MAIKTIKLPTGEEIAVDEWLHWPIYSTLIGQGNATINGTPNMGVNINLFAFSYVVSDRIPVAGQPVNVDNPGQPFYARTSDTNQVVRGKINHDEAIVIFSVTHELFALNHDAPFGDPQAPNVMATAPMFTGTNLRRMQMDCMMAMYVGSNINKPQIQAPFTYYSQGMGAVGYGSGDALAVNFVPDGGGANVTELAYNGGTAGYISPRNQRRYQLPVYVHSDRTIKVKLWTPRGPIVGLDQSWRMRIWLDGLKRRPIG
jgi:hypothetical protein